MYLKSKGTVWRIAPGAWACAVWQEKEPGGRLRLVHLRTWPEWRQALADALAWT